MASQQETMCWGSRPYVAVMMQQTTSSTRKVVLLKYCDLETSFCQTSCSGDTTNASTLMILLSMLSKCEYTRVHTYHNGCPAILCHWKAGSTCSCGCGCRCDDLRDSNDLMFSDLQRHAGHIGFDSRIRYSNGRRQIYTKGYLGTKEVCNSPLYGVFSARQATFSLLILGTVALPALTW
jgi:hypothetical protein